MLFTSWLKHSAWDVAWIFVKTAGMRYFNTSKNILYPLKMLLGRRRRKCLYWYHNSTSFSQLIVVTLKWNLLHSRKHYVYSGNSIGTHVIVMKCFPKGVRIFSLFCYPQTFLHPVDFEVTSFSYKNLSWIKGHFCDVCCKTSTSKHSDRKKFAHFYSFSLPASCLSSTNQVSL